MRMRKILTAAIIGAFTVLTALCLAFGPNIRDALSPNVEYVFPEYLMGNGQMLLTLPAEAVRYDEAGTAYVMAAVVSEKYPERCYEAKRKDLKIYKTEGETAVISYGVTISDRIILTENLHDGQRVVFKNQ